MTNLKLTELEMQIMKEIPNDNFYQEGFESVLWTNTFLDGSEIEGKKARGVLSSLVKKGLIEIEDFGTPDSSISLTEKGCEYLINDTDMNFDEDGRIVEEEEIEEEIEQPEVVVSETDYERIVKAINDLKIEGLEMAQLKNSIMVVLPK